MTDGGAREAETGSLDDLRARLHEAEETLRAIREGEVDAVLVKSDGREKVYTLRSADAPYRVLVEQMLEGAVTLNAMGDIVYANRSFAQLVHTPLEQVIGAPLDRFVDIADRAPLTEIINDGAGIMRTRLVTKRRNYVDVHISVSQVTVDDQEHRTLIVSDLSVLTKVQRENQSKDEFLAMLAHELRNPLAPLRTGLQVLRLTPGEETAGRALEMMDRQLAHMIRLIDDLLDVSRVSRGKIELKKERVDLKTTVNLAVETSLPLIELGRHVLTVTLPPEPLPVDADPTRLAQVFGNLLNNAAKYTPEGGRIELTAERIGSEVEIRVSDNGVGIPRDMVPEVFEMFSQVGKNLDRAQGGLGIGLTLVRRLTEMHGGSVKAESGGSKAGSVFTVTLPLALRAQPAASLPPTDAPDAYKGSGKLSVLVVDDNVDGAQMLSMLVTMQGHKTQMAHTGPEALEKLNDFKANVVFLDIGLPGLNGYEVAQRIRAREAMNQEARCTLIALTGWGSDDDKRRARDVGFDLHLTKPIDARKVELLLNSLPSKAAAEPK